MYLSLPLNKFHSIYGRSILEPCAAERDDSSNNHVQFMSTVSISFCTSDFLTILNVFISGGNV